MEIRILNIKIYSLIDDVYECLTHMYVYAPHVCPVSADAASRDWIPWAYSYRDCELLSCHADAGK